MTKDAVHLVIVTTDDRTLQSWIAATPRNEAVNRVLDVVPEGWTARLADEPIQAHERAVLNIAHGEVRQLQTTIDARPASAVADAAPLASNRA